MFWHCVTQTEQWETTYSILAVRYLFIYVLFSTIYARLDTQLATENPILLLSAIAEL